MWWKVFDLVPGWLYAAVCAALLVVAGVSYVSASRTSAAFADYRAQVAENTRTAEADARAREQDLQRKNERIARELAEREKELAARVAAAAHAVGVLRDYIAFLNARPAPADPGSAAFAREARAARELLAACSERYRAVATDAQGLSDQVTGLQRFAVEVCRAGATAEPK